MLRRGGGNSVATAQGKTRQSASAKRATSPKVTLKSAPKKPPVKPRKPRAAKDVTASPAADTLIDELLLQAEPLSDVPPPSERLGAYGQQCWNRIGPLLVELRVLTRLDLEALEALCHQWHDYLTWHMMIQHAPEKAIVEYESGARQKSPEATLRDSAYDRWLKLLPRFGLSPEHRRKLKRLKEPARGGRSGSRDKDPDVDPIAAFARRKYAEE